MQSIHSKCFAWACLPICKASYYTLGSEEREEGLESHLVNILVGLNIIGVTSDSLKVLSKVNEWSSIYLVIPSTFILGSIILIWGFAHETESIYPFRSSFAKNGLLRTQTLSFAYQPPYFHVYAQGMRHKQLLLEFRSLHHTFEFRIRLFDNDLIFSSVAAWLHLYDSIINLNAKFKKDMRKWLAEICGSNRIIIRIPIMLSLMLKVFPSATPRNLD